MICTLAGDTRRNVINYRDFEIYPDDMALLQPELMGKTPWWLRGLAMVFAPGLDTIMTKVTKVDTAIAVKTGGELPEDADPLVDVVVTYQRQAEAEAEKQAIIQDYRMQSAQTTVVPGATGKKSATAFLIPAAVLTVAGFFVK
jgi:hypothetical protein